jgi:hypothetical protein
LPDLCLERGTFGEGDVFKRGDTYRLYQGEKAWHVYVVVYIDNAGFVAFNFDTIYADAFHDESCLVNEGEHEFIDRPSWINYGRLGHVTYKNFRENSLHPRTWFKK